MNTAHIETALIVLAIISGLTVLGAIIFAIAKGEFPKGLKPIRLNILYVFTMTVMLLVFVALRGFEWLQGFVPDTEWWDGATFMGTLIAGLNIVFGLIALLQAMVNAITTEPDSAPEATIPVSEHRKTVAYSVRAARGEPLEETGS